MRELRWHPYLQTWNMVTGDRHMRPNLPPGCPFCPGGSEDLGPFEIAVFDNRFPALVPDPSEPKASDGPFGRASASGRSEVIVYSPQHEGTLATLPVDQIRKLVSVWGHRERELLADPCVQFVYPFENRGEVAGNTLTHPHGQIYAFPFLPPSVDKKKDAVLKYEASKGACLFCAMAQAEASGPRLLLETDHLISFVPDFARFPFETHILMKGHGVGRLNLPEEAASDLAAAISATTRALDRLFGEPMPGMMGVFPSPRGLEEHWHLHIEFLPLMRKKGALKRLASVESGTGAFVVDEFPEKMAEDLRHVMGPLERASVTILDPDEK